MGEGRRFQFLTDQLILSATKMGDATPASVVELLQSTVRINSVNSNVRGRPGSEEELIGFLEAVAGSFGFATRRCPVEGYGTNLLVLYERERGLPWLLFDSHADTVAAEGMSIDPFGAEIRDGRLWGRGACDTKGSGAAMLWAARGYAASMNGPNNVAILFSVDEEWGMRGIRSFLARDYPSLGFTFRGAIVGEPTVLRPVVAHGGICRFRVVTKGVAAHSSNPSLGRSAISSMMRILQAVETRYVPSLRASHPLIGRAQCSVNTIRGGVASNIIPDRCEIEVDRRMVPGEHPEEVARLFGETLAAVRDEHPEVEYVLESIFEAPPLSADGSAELFATARGVLTSMGLSPEPSGAAYTTHAGAYAAAGLPAIVIGPGDVAKAHTADEWIELAELERSVAVYRGIMEA